MLWIVFAASGLASKLAWAQLHAVPAAAGSAYELDHFSMRSPPGTGWFELKRDKRDVFFGKKLPSPTHSLIAIVVSETVPEKFGAPEQFVDYFTKFMLPTRADQRSAVIEYSVKLDSSLAPYCVRYSTKASDRNAVNARGRTLYAETFGLACLHPANPHLMVDISYTERGQPQEFNPVLRQEGESFVQSLRFTARRGP